MSSFYILSKNPSISNYLYLILNEVAPTLQLSMSIEFSSKTDLLIVDTETMLPEDFLAFSDAETPIVLFAYKLSPLLIQYTSKYDINGVFTFTMEAADILNTLESALKRDIYYNDSMISMLFSNTVNSLTEKIGSLTNRENDIIKRMMLDHTNEEIAKELNLSIRTVNAHKGNIMRKVGAKTMSGLMYLVLTHSPHFKNQL